jgi:hypothetical protein
MTPYLSEGIGDCVAGDWGLPVDADLGLPVPKLDDLYVGPDGAVSMGDEVLATEW